MLWIIDDVSTTDVILIEAVGYPRGVSEVECAADIVEDEERPASVTALVFCLRPRLSMTSIERTSSSSRRPATFLALAISSASLVCALDYRLRQYY